MAKRLTILAGMLVVLLAAAIPAAFAQEETTQGASTTSPPAPPPSDKATLSFELTVKGEPPAGTTFLGFIPAEGGISAPLMDPDGDGVYTGNVTLDRFGPGPRPVPPGTEPVSLPVQIAQNTGGSIQAIKDFGTVPLNGDKTFRARINFKANPGDATTPEDTTPQTTTPEDTMPEATTPTTGTGDSSDNNGSDDGVPTGDSSGTGNSGNGSKGDKASSGPDGIKVLPNTGGATLTTLGAGLLLIGGGLLIRKVFE